MPEPLRPFTRRYTPEQEKAVTHAMLDAKPPLTAKQAVERAAAGTLPGAELEPFGLERRPDGSWVPVPIQTAHYWTRKERRERGEMRRASRAKTEPANALQAAIDDAWEDITRARDAARRAKLTPSQRMRAAREYLAAARAVHDMQRLLDGKAPEQPAAEPEPERPSEAADLAAAARKRAAAEHGDALTTPTSQGAASVSQLDTLSRQQDEGPHSVGREREREAAHDVA